MLNTLKSLTPLQRDAVQDVLLVVIFVVFVGAFSLGKIVSADTPAPWDKDRPKTWQDLVQIMPPWLKRNIAIDFCVTHKGLCRNLPLSSPIGPMDSTKGVKP